MEVKKNRVMEMPNLTSVLHNHDHDGDNMIASALHSVEAKQDFNHMFVNNNIEFEQRDDLLFDFEYEAVYSAYMYTKVGQSRANKETCENIYEVKSFAELRERFFNFNTVKENNIRIKFGNIEMALCDWTINRCLQSRNYDESDENENTFIVYSKDVILNKKKLTKLLWNFYKILKEENKENQLWDLGHELDKFLMEIGTTIDYCNPSFNLTDFDVSNDEIIEYKKHLIQEEPYLAFHQNMILFDDFITPAVDSQDDNILSRISASGARLKSVQLLKAAGNTGIPTDIYGKAVKMNISSSLLDGLTPEEYFATGDSARLALTQRQDAIPKGGELQRKFFFSTGILQYKKDLEDCQENVPLLQRKTTNISIQSKAHLKTMNHRWFIDESGLISEEPALRYIDMETEEEQYHNLFEDMVGKTIRFFAPTSCQSQDFGLCKRCIGKKLPTSKYVGASLGSYIAEGIIQSVLRAHHFGGSFITNVIPEITNALRHSEIGKNFIISSDENIKTIKTFLYTKYKDEDIELTEEENGNKIKLTINVINEPFNDDSVKILTSIVSLIDKNRKHEKFIEPEEIYNQLVEVIVQNGLLSVYFEMILSLIFYDEDEKLVRYSDKPAIEQIALKGIIDRLDPKLAFFYNFSNRAIANVYKMDTTVNSDHMYNELLRMYY